LSGQAADRRTGLSLLAFAAVGEPGTALRAGIAAACVALLAALQLPAASGAGSSSERAQSLRDENAALAGRAQAAWLSSVSLGTRLEETRAGLVRLQARTKSIAAERAEADESLRLARRTLTISQHRLARRVRLLYEQGDTDPMAVLVGAKSIEEALNGLEGIHRIARQDRLVIEQAEAARARLIVATKRLAAREAQARRAEAATSATLAALEAARREQAAQVAAYRAEQSSNSAAISSLEAEARKLAAAPSGSQAGRTLTVSATGYSLEGRTSTGVSVGYGVVAVDPNVIPLGTKMTIPGYGEGVAADTGGAVVGARIDLWFPTLAEALAWGTRTVSITLH
jgi:3D (Asp-Asp-Asp) domain-containing protein